MSRVDEQFANSGPAARSATIAGSGAPEGNGQPDVHVVPGYLDGTKRQRPFCSRARSTLEVVPESEKQTTDLPRTQSTAGLGMRLIDVADGPLDLDNVVGQSEKAPARLPGHFAQWSARTSFESSEIICESQLWPDSRRVTAWTAKIETPTILPQRNTISERSDRRRMGASGVVDPTGQADGGNKRHVRSAAREEREIR